jgi:hypothetical protein
VLSATRGAVVEGTTAKHWCLGSIQKILFINQIAQYQVSQKFLQKRKAQNPLESFA